MALPMRIAACLLVALLVSRVAEAAPTAQQQAYTLFQESAARFRVGDFAGAAERLRRAHDLYPEPTLLYNLGRALEGAGDVAGAIGAYTQYLHDDRALVDRGAIEQQIATLRHQLDERDRLSRERVEADRARREAEQGRADAELKLTRPVPRAPASPLVAPWVVLSLGGAALGAGAVTGGLALARHDDAVHEATQARSTSLQSSARTLAIGADVSFAVGGALAVAGLVWGLVEVHHRRVLARSEVAP